MFVNAVVIIFYVQVAYITVVITFTVPVIAKTVQICLSFFVPCYIKNSVDCFTHINKSHTFWINPEKIILFHHCVYQ